MNAKDVIEFLKLEPLPWEGGYFRQTYKSDLLVNTVNASNKVASTAIYYLITEEEFSAFHRLKHDEVFHFYCGDTVEFVQIDQDGKLNTSLMGSKILSGEIPQLIVAANVWQGLRLAKGGKWALLGTTVAPGYEQADFELADQKKMQAEFPQHKNLIERYTRS